MNQLGHSDRCVRQMESTTLEPKVPCNVTVCWDLINTEVQTRRYQSRECHFEGVRVEVHPESRPKLRYGETLLLQEVPFVFLVQTER